MEETAPAPEAITTVTRQNDSEMSGEVFRQVSIRNDIFDRWQKVGTAEGFITDSQIASYLIQQYEKGQSGAKSTACCVLCHTSLQLFCSKCQLCFQQNGASDVTAVSASDSFMPPQTGGPGVKDGLQPPADNIVEENDLSCNSSFDRQMLHQVSDIKTFQTKHNSLPDVCHTQSLRRNQRRTFHKRTPRRSARSKQQKNCQARDLPEHLLDKEHPDDGIADEKDSSGTVPRRDEPSLHDVPGIVDGKVEQESEVQGDSSLAGANLDNGVEDGKLFRCSECPATYTVPYKLKVHMRSHSQEKPYSCPTCAAVFKWNHSLREHLQKVHGVAALFPCKTCEKSFSSHPELKQHMKQSHGKGKAVEKCTECNAVFSKARGLRIHMLTHTGEKPFVCPLCKACFITKDKLRVHMRRHTGERPYVCKVCGATFKESTVLKTHIRRHTGEKPYMCKECGAAFAQSSALRTHIRIHTGEKPHMCTVCGAAFASSGRLDRHMRVHTGDRPYVCSQCGSAFKSSGELTNHMRTHTNYKPAVCKECGRSFSQFGNLKSHMRTHTGERPYICEVCSMPFRQQSALKMHMLMHTDEKPNVCEICGNSYRKAQSLRQHKQKKHPPTELNVIPVVVSVQVM